MDQLAELTGSLGGRFSESRALAGELIRRGWLTPYQVNQLFQGRGGDLLLESYVLMERLGEGGMGQVFKARNWKLGRCVALKVIRKDRLADAGAVRRFQREVRAAAQLNHPNVVHAYDSGEADERHFYVMEYVEGIDLARLVQRNGPLPATQACDCIRQAALGLQHAFERGLVHRDIKPHNLLLTHAADGSAQVKILDLGLALMSQADEGGDRSGTMTREGVVMGTVDYIAPEQALNAHAADTRADLYSLGCTLYFLLAGKPPFPGGTATEKLLKHQLEWPTPIQQFRPDVSESVAALLDRSLAKRPEQRYQTPAEMAAAMASILSGAKIVLPAARPAALSAATPAVPLRSGTQALEDTSANWSSIVDRSEPPDAGMSFRRRRAAQRRAMGWWLMAGVALLLLIVLVTAVLRARKSPPPASQRAEADPAAQRDADAQAFEEWVKKVAKQTPEWQARTVAAKLKERNPGFDGKVKPTINGDTLEGLEFSSDKVIDLSPLRPLSGLKTLNCSGTVGQSQLADLSPLKGLPLVSLTCSGTRVADLSPLEGMRLTFLDCQNAPIDDLTPLKGMPLQSLFCNGTRVKDLSPLQDMPLQDLRCSDTPLCNLSPLKNMKLTNLHCDRSRVADLTPLTNLPLTTLSVSDTAVTDLSPLKGMRLAGLECTGTGISDLSPLKGMPLTSLGCSRTKVADLSPLKGMRLHDLRCAETDVASLEPLQGIPLEQLVCGNTRIADLSPLKGMRLTMLHLEKTAVADLSPLAGMPLTGLICYNTKVAGLSPLKGLPLVEIMCDVAPKRDAEILRSIATLQRINGRSVEDFWKQAKP